MINALIERWWPEIHTFHFSVGECAVILEDVAIILGLPINGLSVIGPTLSSFEALEAECLHQFGVAPRKTDCRGSFIKLTWFRGLRDRIVLNDDVHIQISLYRATRVDCKEMDGPLTLLLTWAWIRLPFLALIPGNPRVFPIANTWRNWDRDNYAYRYNSLAHYRRLLDDLQEGHAYGIGDIDPNVIPLDICHNSVIWSATVPLISFECIEWHASDRVRRKFRLRQGVPNQERDLEIYMHWYREAFGDHLQLSNLVFQENPEVPPPPLACEPTRGPAPAPTPPPPPPPGPPQQGYWGGQQFEPGEQASFSQLLGFMAPGSHHSHSGNYVDIPTTGQAHPGGITPVRRLLDSRHQVRTSSDNFGAKMSVDSSRSAEGAGGIIQSGNPRRIPMSLIQESNRAVDDETDNYLVDHPEDANEGEDEGEDKDDDEDEGDDEDEDDDDAVEEDPAPSADTATSEKGKGYIYPIVYTPLWMV
ncbi:uncharacterized protein DS421_9g262690 [Arachis hypogaea]|nr:uncharacterized protein DS421_9g262690 [Arachis hypogaea]